MSAAIFGANLLEEVQEESLDQLLSSLRRNSRSHAQFKFNIPQLDDLVALFHQHSSAVIDHAQHRSSPEFYHEEHDEHSDERINVHTVTSEGGDAEWKPPIIELAHGDSTAAKAKLLYHIVTVSVLPKSHGGNEATVVWLDTESRFSATELHQACLTYDGKSILANKTPISRAIAEASLQHVHVFTIQSSRQLLAILENLHLYLLNPNTTSPTPPSLPTHLSHHRPLSLILLDSATTFYWPDQFDTEIARLESIHTPGTAPSSSSAPSSTTLLSHLHRLQLLFGCSILYTTHHTLTQIPPRPTDNLPPLLSPWTTAATLSLTLARIPVPQFAGHMGLDECLRDRERRAGAVGRNRVRVGVSDEWLDKVARREVREGLGGRARAAFVVRWEGEGGLVVEDAEGEAG